MPHNGANEDKGHNGDAQPRELEDRLEHARASIDETLSAIELKLTPRQLMDETVSYLKLHGPGPYVTEFADQLKEHPVPAALTVVGAAWVTRQAAHVAAVAVRRPIPTALIVIGLAWFKTSRARGTAGELEYWRDDQDRDTLEGFGRKIQAGADSVLERMARGIERVREGTAAAASSAGESAADLREHASRAASNAVHHVEETAGHVMETAAGAGAAMKGTAREALLRTREVARTAAVSSERVVESARKYTRRGKEKTMYVASELDRTVRRHPLVTALFLAAAGGVVAAMLPQTRREEEYFSETGEQLKEAARNQLERGKQVVSAAVEGALEGARQGAIDATEEDTASESTDAQGHASKGENP